MEANAIQIVDPVASGTTGAIGRLSGTFDQFLTLLTTQMQYQDPLAPMDSTQFISQLVQFSSVEQAIHQNLHLKELIELQKTNQAALAVSFIGMEVVANGAEATLVDGEAEWRYTFLESAATSTISILDENGELVRRLDGETAAGEHVLTWDGRNDQGQPVADGVYTIQVTATTANESPVAVSTDFVGRVTGVSTDNGKITLDVNGISVSVEAVISVKEAPAES